MKEIKLSQKRKNKYSHLVALVDDDMFEYLNQWNWFANKSYSSFYAARKTYDKKTRKREWVFMHREIMKTPNGMFTDHIDHNPLNNLRSNLRICTNQQNQMNMLLKKKDNTSKYKGVNFHVYKRVRKDGTRDEKWRAQIMLNGKRICIGRFDIEIKAALAYNTKAKELFGEFASLNVVPPVRYYQTPMLIPAT